MKGEIERVLPCGRATIRFELYRENGVLICSIDQLDGHIDLPPRRWLSLVRGELSALENSARVAGCKEMRMAGRDWARIFPDYLQFKPANNSNGLRKIL